MKKRNWPKQSIILLLFAVSIAVFYSHRVLLDGVNIGEDILECDIPQISFFVDTVKSGYFPLWNPHKILGLPFTEVSFMGPYYPLTVLYFIFDIGHAINYAFLFHIFISACFMMLLCKEFKFSLFPMVFCVLSWSFSSLFQQFLNDGWLPQVVSLTYLPGLVYFFIKIQQADRSKKNIFAVFGGLILGLSITGGIPHYSAIIIYSFLIFIAAFIKTKHDIKSLLLIFVVGLSISLIYWGPLLIDSLSGLFAPRPVKFFSGYSIKNLLNFIVPSEMRLGYFGKIGFILAVIGVFLRTRISKNIRSLLLVSLVLMFSHHRIFGFRIIDFIPFANKEDYVWIWHTGLIFSFILAAGLTLEKISTFFKKKYLYVFFVTLCIVGQVFDLFVYQKKIFKTKFKYELEQYFPKSPIFEFLHQDNSMFRVYNPLFDFQYYRVNQGMLEDVSCIQATSRGVSIPRISGKTEIHSSFGDQLLFADRTPVLDIANVKYLISHIELSPERYIKRITMKNILTAEMSYQLNNTEKTPEIMYETIYLYENKKVLPRAFLIDNDIMQTLSVDINKYSENSCFSNLQIIEKDISIFSQYTDVVIKYYPNKYMINFNSSSDSFLFLSEMYHRYWEAELDGESAEIVSPYNVFMGVFVPEGEHVVEFSYKPLMLYIFGSISVVSVLLISVFMLLSLKKKLRV